MSDEDIAIVVPSCDKFSDVWNTFYSFFFKYWPDCPYKIYHGSNFLRFQNPRVTSLISNADDDWSARLKNILGQIKEKYIILILEDYFIYTRVDNKALHSALGVMEKYNALFLRTACWASSYNEIWPYEKLTDFPFAGKIKANATYRITTQIGIWNRELLISLLKNGESIWEFEIDASKRSEAYQEPCLCLVEDPNINYTHGPITYLCTAISKGIWMREAIELSKKENIKIESNRPVENRLEYFIRYIYMKTPLSKRKYLDFIKYRVLKTRF